MDYLGGGGCVGREEMEAGSADNTTRSSKLTWKGWKMLAGSGSEVQGEHLLFFFFLFSNFKVEENAYV